MPDTSIRRLLTFGPGVVAVANARRTLTGLPRAAAAQAMRLVPRPILMDEVHRRFPVNAKGRPNPLDLWWLMYTHWTGVTYEAVVIDALDRVRVVRRGPRNVGYLRMLNHAGGYPLWESPFEVLDRLCQEDYGIGLKSFRCCGAVHNQDERRPDPFHPGRVERGQTVHIVCLVELAGKPRSGFWVHAGNLSSVPYVAHLLPCIELAYKLHTGEAQEVPLLNYPRRPAA